MERAKAANKKRELEHFYIGKSYGGNQDWFSNRWMRMGGCAAETVCDISVYLAMHKGMTELYPLSLPVTQEDYVAFSDIMEPYLKPRWTGIDKLEIYIKGASRYFQDRGQSIKVLPWAGSNSLEATKEVVKRQIDKGMPIPCLTLKHKNPAMDFYVWHWYLLNGYEEAGDRLMVKLVTYSNWAWLDLETLWETGYERRGGLILLELD